MAATSMKQTTIRVWNVAVRNESSPIPIFQMHRVFKVEQNSFKGQYNLLLKRKALASIDRL